MQYFEHLQGLRLCEQLGGIQRARRYRGERGAGPDEGPRYGKHLRLLHDLQSAPLSQKRRLHRAMEYEPYRARQRAIGLLDCGSQSLIPALRREAFASLRSQHKCASGTNVLPILRVGKIRLRILIVSSTIRVSGNRRKVE